MRHESRRRAQRLLEQLQASMPDETIQNQLAAAPTQTPWEIFDGQIPPLARMAGERAE